METRTLLKLKEEILSCNETPRLLELEINLRHFISIYSTHIEDDSADDEEQIKDVKNSISLAKSYLSVINWKLAAIKIELENKKIAILTEIRQPLYQMFEGSFEMYLNEYGNTRKLREENSELKQLLNEAKIKSNSQILTDEKKLQKIKEKSLDLYNQISDLMTDETNNHSEND